MIQPNEQVENAGSKPLARRFRTPEMAEAYVLGLEDAKRCLGAQDMLGVNAWYGINELWMETKGNYQLDIPDPPDLEHVRKKYPNNGRR